MPKNVRPAIPTKLATVLRAKGMTQTDLYNILRDELGKEVGRDRINRITRGYQKDYMVSTARLFCASPRGKD